MRLINGCHQLTDQNILVSLTLTSCGSVGVRANGVTDPLAWAAWGSVLVAQGLARKILPMREI